MTRLAVDSVARFSAAHTRAPTARIAVWSGWFCGCVPPAHAKTSLVVGRVSVPMTLPDAPLKVQLVPLVVPVKLPSDVCTVNVCVA